MAEEQECSHSCGSCGVEGCGERTAPSKYTTNAASNVKHVIGVVSGKGGVGKSLVTSLLASELRKKGFNVGILDADVTGPSIPKTFGVTDKLHADETGIYPALTDSGIKVMSVNLMLPKGDMPVAWRGPVVSGIIKQFWDETNWGDVDYMLIDMPPGTSDVFLTVFQMLPVDGIVTVSAPQELVAMIVGKAVNLAHDLDVPVVGLVENMAYFKCDECGKEHHIFGEPQGAAVAEKYGIPGVITGFEPVDVLQGIAMIMRQLHEGRAEIEIAYARGVMPEGNPVALAAIDEVFETCSATWRGLGEIPGSGYRIREEFADFDAMRRFQPDVEEVREHKGCRCGDVLRGIMAPSECPLFRKICTPENPVGPCMVSSEGSCAAYYRYY